MTIPVVRNFGSNGNIRVYYQTEDGSAHSVAGLDPDYRATQNYLTFLDQQTELNFRLEILDDAIAEHPEEFYVNLTRVELLYPT